MMNNGERINQYTLIRLLGKGGMSEVYLVEDNLGRQYALKILSARLTEEASFRERFKHEARIMASLNHPHIVGLHSYFEEGDSYCLAMEYMSGGSLKDLVRRRGPLPEAQALAIFSRIGQALAYAHSRGIIHRDVKPSNILLGADGGYKLGDFGIARMQDSQGLTKTGSRMGTLVYMSPEQVRDSKNVDSKTDVYSLGVTLWEMLTGRAPYDEAADSDYDIMDRIVRQDLPDPRTVYPHISVSTVDILARATRKDSAGRAGDGDLMPPAEAEEHHGEKQIHESGKTLGPEPIPVTELKNAKPGRRAVIRWVSFIALILAAVAAIFFWPGLVDAFTAAKDIEMIRVEGGAFQMGSNDGPSDERPVHRVSVSPFYIGKYEVTQAQWREVMGAKPFNWKSGDRPVERVSWYDAVEFCNRLSSREGLTSCYSGSGASISCNFGADGYRLPTEAEWEFAARGGNSSQGYTYSGSNDLGSVAWYEGNSGSRTHNVGGKAANELGLHDMSGNVWEWCWDWYGGTYYQSSPSVNPRGPGSGSYRTLRGGSWDNGGNGCRVADRSDNGPDNRGNGVGFRLTRAIP